MKKLARQLKIRPVTAVGHLTTLWSNVLELAENGDITKWSIEDIAEYSNWEGEPQTFYIALKNEGDGFIDEKENHRLIHDWFDYAGKYLTAKYRTNNPQLLEEIKVMYSRYKVSIKSVNSQPTNLYNLPTTQRHFYTVYKKKTGLEYVAQFGKDGAIFKNLLKTHAEAEVIALIDKFFVSQDPFILKAGFTVGVFQSQINKLQTKKPEVRYD